MLRGSAVVAGEKQLVMFDCDGVLFDSEQANIAFYNEVLRKAGQPPLDEPRAAACHAMASNELFEAFFHERPAVLERVREIARQTDYGPYFALMRPHPGLRAIVASLRQRFHTAMATNRGKTTHQVLKHFGLSDVFDLAVGVNDVARPKPSPDMLLHCLDRFAVDPVDAVYVGDQKSDLLAARAAGVHFIGVGAVESEATLKLQSLSELEGVLEQLFGREVSL